MIKYIFEILDEVSKAKSKSEKVAILKKNESWALKDVIRGSMDETVQWLLPKGEVPYTPSEPHNHPTNLLRENTKFTYFVRGGKGMQVKPYKRESIFLGMLEGIHPEDAKICVNMINKNTPKGLTKSIVEEAFPGLLKS